MLFEPGQDGAAVDVVLADADVEALVEVETGDEELDMMDELTGGATDEAFPAAEVESVLAELDAAELVAVVVLLDAIAMYAPWMLAFMMAGWRAPPFM